METTREWLTTSHFPPRHAGASLKQGRARALRHLPARFSPASCGGLIEAARGIVWLSPWYHFPPRHAGASLKPIFRNRDMSLSPDFPPRHAGASLKPGGRVPDGPPYPHFPPRHAGASLKPGSLYKGLEARANFPPRHAGASLKREMVPLGGRGLARFSPASCGGLIEATPGATRGSSPRHFPPRHAGASLKRLRAPRILLPTLGRATFLAGDVWNFPILEGLRSPVPPAYPRKLGRPSSPPPGKSTR